MGLRNQHGGRNKCPTVGAPHQGANAINRAVALINFSSILILDSQAVRGRFADGSQAVRGRFPEHSSRLPELASDCSRIY